MQMGTDCGPGRDRAAARPAGARAPAYAPEPSAGQREPGRYAPGSSAAEDAGRSPVRSEQLSLLTVAQPQLWSAADADRLDDLLHRCGGHLFELDPIEAGPAGAVVDMVFDSVEEAMTAAITLRRAARGRPDRAPDPLSGDRPDRSAGSVEPSAGTRGPVLGDGSVQRWQNLRVVVMTAVGGGPASPIAGVTRTWAHRLVRQATAGQTLVTSAVAIQAAGRLLPGLDLASRGTWRPTVSEHPDRIYELVEVDPGRAQSGGSNLGWAMAVLHGRDADPGDRAVIEQTVRAWGSGALNGTVTILGGVPPSPLRCTAELALAAHAGGSTVLYGTWTDDHTDRYGVYREAFGTYASRSDDRQLIADLEGHAHELARLLPEVGAAVGGAHLVLGGQPDLARLCDCLETWLTKMAQRTPVLLVLDHAELMTAASELVLTQLAHSLSGTPVRFLLADHGVNAPTRRVVRLMDHLGSGLCVQLTVA